MSSFATDLHQAIRLLTKSPRFTLIVTLTLAIGIASNTIILSTVQSVFVKPMAYPDPGRLVYVSQAYPGFPAGGGQFSYPIFRDIQQQNRTLDSVAAYQVTGPLALTGVGEPVRVPITYCTPSYLKLLGVRATLGRVFYDSEDRFGSADAVVVLSNGFWRRQFAGNAAIVGQTIQSIDLGIVTAPVNFKTPQGFVPLDRAAFVAIATEMAAHVQSTFDKEGQVDAQIQAGTITTKAAVDAALTS